MRKILNEELDRKSVEDFKNAEKIPVCLVLDNVRSLNNVGSAFRTSDAFLIEKIYLGGITGTPPHRDIQKTALGATESVEWEHAPKPLELLKALKSEGYTIISIEQVENSISLENFEASSTEKYCLIFGNEVFGVDQEIVNQSDASIEIPQYGTKHSLNISVSIGIVVWEFFRKLSK